MDEGFSEIAKALMPYETSNNSLSRPEAKGLEWLSEKLAKERCPWTLHEGGVISTVHGGAADAVVILLNVRGTVKSWLKDRGRHIHVYVLPMWYEDRREISFRGGGMVRSGVESYDELHDFR